MDMRVSYKNKAVFGLDIGTRSIVGTVGYREGDRFVVLGQKSKEHDTRAMLDGQIHDIARVAKTISEVRHALEVSLDMELNDVCIAAAGRVLRTINVHVENVFEQETIVTREDILSLVSKAVEQSYVDFKEQYPECEKVKFYCVGYSVTKYYLNDFPITNLEDHKASTIAVDVIATFLPEDVVDGLYRAVEIAGLQVANLTLEPIAAMHVAIPPKFRMLNMALVDVGAGTSDISITRDGSIVSYGMIPKAGDAMTELVMQYCLTDFDTAEQIKRAALTQETYDYQDIMGLPHTITREEILKAVAPAVEDEASQIADCIMKLNGEKAVSAVFVVGGGGKVPSFTPTLAEKLGIPSERVAVRGAEVMGEISFEDDDAMKDSLFVTPIGICLSYYEQSNNFIFVNFNKARIKIYDNSKLSVVDAAIQADFPNDGLFPKRGKELNFFVNGKNRLVRGLPGEAAVITVNGANADIHTTIHSNDVIVVKESTAGLPATQKIEQLTEYKDTLRVMVNDRKVLIPRFALVNGQLQNGDYEIVDGDEIEFLDFCTVEQLLTFMDVELEEDKVVLVNNRIAEMETKIYENFTVELTTKKIADDMAMEIEAEIEAAEGGKKNDENDSVEDEEDLEESEEAGEESQENATEEKRGSGRPMNVIVNNKPITLRGKASYVFVDIFDVIDFDLSSMKGDGLVTLLNGNEAEFMAPIHEDDVIEVYWKM